MRPALTYSREAASPSIDRTAADSARSWAAQCRAGQLEEGLGYHPLHHPEREASLVAALAVEPGGRSY